jgi:glycerate kinase
MRVIIAPDKFKGTLSAKQAAKAMARGWRSVRSADSLVLAPISDGGDGFGQIMAAAIKATPVRCRTMDAAGRPVTATWWWQPRKRIAIIEAATVIGLAKLPAGVFHPFKLDTRGLARVLRAAHRRGAQRCVIGIGGSATNDGGFGLAHALGWRFFDERDQPITVWTELHRLTRLQQPLRQDWPSRIEVAVDVQNQLLGAHGCTRIFGPQKGLKQSQFTTAERNLAKLAKVVHDECGHNHAKKAGAGAAGGLGFGLAAFVGATLRPGFSLVAEALRLPEQVRHAQLVLTGEGRLDASSLMGKATGEIARLCRSNERVCLALAGTAQTSPSLKVLFGNITALTDIASAEGARRKAAYHLQQLAAQAARNTCRNPTAQ